MIAVGSVVTALVSEAKERDVDYLEDNSITV